MRKELRWTLVGCLVLLTLAGCGKTTDQTDPQATAIRFFEALRAGDTDRAARLVVPDERDFFRKEAADPNGEIARIMAKLPKSISVRVQLKRGGRRADVTLTGSSGDYNMKLVDGKWWICQ